MPPIPNYYEVLGVAEDASAEDIKRVYRKLAREHHPDRNPDNAAAEERFKEIQQAYEVLGNAEKRQQYDRLRRDPFAGQGGVGSGGFGPGGGQFYRAPDGTYVRVESTGFGPEGGFSFTDDGGVGDLFERFFGGRQRGAGGTGFGGGHQPGAGDVEARVPLTFEQALRGGQQDITITGGDTLRVTIPKGVEDGTRVRLRGQGRVLPGGRRGDLYLTFEVQPSTRYEREGRSVIMRETINVAEAILGTSRTVSTPYGKQVRLQIPEGTQPGARLRLRGQGVQTDDGTGDLFVEIQVSVPTGMSEEDKAAVRSWAEQGGLLERKGAESTTE
jgi:curved DNA-binding protein